MKKGGPSDRNGQIGDGQPRTAIKELLVRFTCYKDPLFIRCRSLCYSLVAGAAAFAVAFNRFSRTIPKNLKADRPNPRDLEWNPFHRLRRRRDRRCSFSSHRC